MRTIREAVADALKARRRPLIELFPGSQVIPPKQPRRRRPRVRQPDRPCGHYWDDRARWSRATHPPRCPSRGCQKRLRVHQREACRISHYADEVVNDALAMLRAVDVTRAELRWGTTRTERARFNAWVGQQISAGDCWRTLCGSCLDKVVRSECNCSWARAWCHRGPLASRRRWRCPTDLLGYSGWQVAQIAGDDVAQRAINIPLEIVGRFVLTRRHRCEKRKKDSGRTCRYGLPTNRIDDSYRPAGTECQSK